MTMPLVLLAFVGLWLLLWAIFLGAALLARLDDDRQPLTLLDDTRIEL